MFRIECVYDTEVVRDCSIILSKRERGIAVVSDVPAPGWTLELCEDVVPPTGLQEPGKEWREGQTDLDLRTE